MKVLAVLLLASQPTFSLIMAPQGADSQTVSIMRGFPTKKACDEAGLRYVSEDPHRQYKCVPSRVTKDDPPA